MLNTSRRSFLTGLASLIAAPAVVGAASLMPVRGIVMPVERTVAFWPDLSGDGWDLRQEFEGYIAHKYDARHLLLAGHPFRDFQPLLWLDARIVEFISPQT